MNASWLIGSLGTLLLDLGIFVQFFMYRSVPGQGLEASIDGYEEDAPGLDGVQQHKRGRARHEP